MSNKLLDRFIEQSYAPYSNSSSENIVISRADKSGAQQTRSQILTDEGGYRANFPNNTLNVDIGNCTFTNNSNIVIGNNFDTYNLHVGDYVYLNTDGTTFASQITYFTKNKIILSEPYTGTGGTGLSSRTILKPIIGSGASISVSSGKCTLSINTTNGTSCELFRYVDFLPLEKTTYMQISTRLSNQIIKLGFYSIQNSVINSFAYFVFDGTSNKFVKTSTGWNPKSEPTDTEIEENNILLPDNLLTSQNLLYKIVLLNDRVIFYVNDIPISTHRKIIPHPYTCLYSTINVRNIGTTSTSNTILLELDSVKNFNNVTIEPSSTDTKIISDVEPTKTITTYMSTTAIAVNTILTTINTSNYRTLFVFGVAGTGGAITCEVFNSLTNTWLPTRLIPISGGAITTTISTSNGAWIVPVYGTLIRFRVSTAITGGTTALEISGNKETVFSESSTLNVIGLANHGSTISGNPLRIAARAINTNYSTVANGAIADLITTLVGALVTRPYSIPELDWMATDSINNSTTPILLRSSISSNKIYLTGFSLATTTLSSAIEIQIRDTPVTTATATISGNTLVMPSTYNWKIGDMIYVISSTVTGLNAGSYYYILTVSGNNLTFTSTRGGSTLPISGTSVSATLAHILFRTQLQTQALPLNDFVFTSPLSTGTGLGLEVCTPISTNGRIDINARGYIAP